MQRQYFLQCCYLSYKQMDRRQNKDENIIAFFKH